METNMRWSKITRSEDFCFNFFCYWHFSHALPLYQSIEQTNFPSAKPDKSFFHFGSCWAAKFVVSQIICFLFNEKFEYACERILKFSVLYVMQILRKLQISCSQIMHTALERKIIDWYLIDNYCKYWISQIFPFCHVSCCYLPTSLLSLHLI